MLWRWFLFWIIVLVVEEASFLLRLIPTLLLPLWWFFFVCVLKFVHKSHASQWFPTTLCGARFKDTHLKDIFICKHRIRIPGELNNQSFIRYQIKSKENVLYDNLFMGLNFCALQYPLASTHKHIHTHTEPSDIWCPLIISFIIHAINMHILIAAHLQLEWYYLDISESNFGVRAISIYNSLFLWLPSFLLLKMLFFCEAMIQRWHSHTDDTQLLLAQPWMQKKILKN